MPISWPPKDDSTLLMPGRVAAGEDADEEDAVEAADAVHGDRADRVVDPQLLLDVRRRDQTASMPPEIESRYASDGW